MLSFAWQSLEEARIELERAAGGYVVGIRGGSVVPPETRIVLLGATPSPPPPYATPLCYNHHPQRKVFGYMWVVVAAGMPHSTHLRFQESWVALVEFVLGRLLREQQESTRQEMMVSCIFHEIRNPLTAILNSVDLLLEGALGVTSVVGGNTPATETRTHNLRLIETNVTYLLQVTTDLLELFRMSQNRIACKVTPTSLRTLLTEVSDIFFSEDLRVVIAAIPETVPSEILCDATKYKQILINLLSNSRKFGATVVTLRVAYRAGCLYTEIADNGPGVAVSTPLNPFKSLGKSTTGLGIGLFMCRKLAELMHGSIILKQNSPQGCTFALRLPVEKVIPTETLILNSPKLKPSGDTPTKNLRILIVDDNAAIRDTLQQMLQSLPMVGFADTAFDGQDAIEKVNSTPYDWVFMDLKMPRKSGWQAAREILGVSGGGGGTPKIIFISAYSLSGTEKLASQQLGVSGFIQKPFRKPDVLKILGGEGGNNERGGD